MTCVWGVITVKYARKDTVFPTFSILGDDGFGRNRKESYTPLSRFLISALLQTHSKIGDNFSLHPTTWFLHSYPSFW